MMHKSWVFPPSFSKLSEGTDMVQDDPDILQSVRVLFSTKPGERFLVPDYGFDWSDLLFEPANGQSNSLFNLEYLRQRLSDVLAVFEPRVELESVEVSAEETDGMVTIELFMLVKHTGKKLWLQQQIQA